MEEEIKKKKTVPHVFNLYISIKILSKYVLSNISQKFLHFFPIPIGPTFWIHQLFASIGIGSTHMEKDTFD